VPLNAAICVFKDNIKAVETVKGRLVLSDDGPQVQRVVGTSPAGRQQAKSGQGTPEKGEAG